MTLAATDTEKLQTLQQRHLSNEIMRRGTASHDEGSGVSLAESMRRDREAAKATIDVAAALAEVFSRHGNTYGPTRDDALRWVTLLDNEAAYQRELNSCPWVVSDDGRLLEIVRRVIKRIPDRKAQMFALRDCMFHGLSPEAAGMSFPLIRRWNICIPDVFLFLYSDSEIDHIVAHEIAHGVTYSQLVNGASEDEFEAIADTLLEEWGFGSRPVLADRSLSAALLRWEKAQGRVTVQEWKFIKREEVV